MQTLDFWRRRFSLQVTWIESMYGAPGIPMPYVHYPTLSTSISRAHILDLTSSETFVSIALSSSPVHVLAMEPIVSFFPQV
jgi:hypothetical protein